MSCVKNCIRFRNARFSISGLIQRILSGDFVGVKKFTLCSSPKVTENTQSAKRTCNVSGLADPWETKVT